MAALERLRAAGLVRGDVDDDVSTVLDGLSEHEVDVLVTVGERLGLGDVEGFALGGLGAPSLSPSINPIMRPMTPIRGISPIAEGGGNSGNVFF